MNYKKTNEIWKHFSQVNVTKANCGYCRHMISAKGGFMKNLN